MATIATEHEGVDVDIEGLAGMEEGNIGWLQQELDLNVRLEELAPSLVSNLGKPSRKQP